MEFEIDHKIQEDDVTWFPAVKGEGESGDVEEVMKALEDTITEMKGYSDSIIDKSIENIDGAN